MKRLFTLLAAGLIVFTGITACAPSEPIEVTENTVIVDVRTPGEFEGSHLENAINLDWNAGVLTAELENLDPEKNYLVYCKSGNRAGKAVAAMKDHGIENVTNVGSISEAAEVTSLEIVR